MKYDHDLIVIGLRLSGQKVAIVAAKLDRKVAMYEK